MWCRGVLVVSSGPLEGQLTGSSWYLRYHPYVEFAPKRVRQRDWTIAVNLGCPISLWTSSFWTNWCHLIPSSICKHHWSNASIFHALTLAVVNHSQCLLGCYLLSCVVHVCMYNCACGSTFKSVLQDLTLNSQREKNRWLAHLLSNKHHMILHICMCVIMAKYRFTVLIHLRSAT